VQDHQHPSIVPKPQSFWFRHLLLLPLLLLPAASGADIPSPDAIVFGNFVVWSQARQALSTAGGANSCPGLDLRSVAITEESAGPPTLRSQTSMKLLEAAELAAAAATALKKCGSTTCPDSDSPSSGRDEAASLAAAAAAALAGAHSQSPWCSGSKGGSVRGGAAL
jgi:hypothetical protein